MSSSTPLAREVGRALTARADRASIDFQPVENDFGGHDFFAQDGSGWYLRVAHDDAESATVDLHVFNCVSVVLASATLAGCAPGVIALTAVAMWEQEAGK